MLVLLAELCHFISWFCQTAIAWHLPKGLGKTWQKSGKTHGNSGIYALTEPILIILENLEVIYGETQHKIPK
jgi:hypothetical protein